MPPAFLAPSMEPIQFNEPWPKARPRRRNGSASLLVRFGLAASGAAVVALFALPDMRSRLYNTVSEPLAGLSSNAAAVFGEGKPVLGTRRAHDDDSRSHSTDRCRQRAEPPCRADTKSCFRQSRARAAQSRHFCEE